MGIFSIFKRNQENKNVPIEVAFLDFLEKSGVNSRISLAEATNSAAVFACRAAITESFSMLPIYMIQELDDRKIRIKEHPLYPILRDKPNPLMDSFNYFEKKQNDLLDYGNAYSFIERSRGSDILAVWPLQADRMEPKIENNKLFYKYSPDGEKTKIYEQKDIFHIRDQSVDGVLGQSRLKIASKSFLYAKSLIDYGNAYFQNGAFVGGLLSADFNFDTDDDRKSVVDSFKKYLGVKNANKVALLEKGLKYEPFKVNAKDAQVAEAMKQAVIDTARIYRMPPHMIQALEDGASYASIEQMAISFVQYCIQPWVTRWERAIRRWLLLPDQDERDLYVKFNISALIRGDLKSRTEAIVQQLQYGLKTLNEGRSMLDDNRVDDPMADEILVSHNLRPLKDLGKDIKEEKVDEDLDIEPEDDPMEEAEKDKETEKTAKNVDKNEDFERFKPLFNDLMGRVLRRISAVADSCEKRGAPDSELITKLSELETVFVETFASACNCARSGREEKLPVFWGTFLDCVWQFRNLVGAGEFKNKLPEMVDESAGMLLREVLK